MSNLARELDYKPAVQIDIEMDELLAIPSRERIPMHEEEFICDVESREIYGISVEKEFDNGDALVTGTYIGVPSFRRYGVVSRVSSGKRAELDRYLLPPERKDSENIQLQLNIQEENK